MDNEEEKVFKNQERIKPTINEKTETLQCSACKKMVSQEDLRILIQETLMKFSAAVNWICSTDLCL